jgi:lysophospholipase L1-like esterase
MKPLVRLCFILLWIWCAAAATIAGEFQIHNGDRVVFLGDSITEQRLYTTYIEGYALTRFPTWKLSFRNVGWGGDTSWLRQRAHPDEKQLFAADENTLSAMVKDAVGKGLNRDVLPLRPMFVTIKFGMNDHSYQAFREDIFRAYVRSQTELAELLKRNGARVAFLTPQPIEDKRPDPDKDIRNQSLRKFCDGLKEVAAKEGATFVDQFDPFMQVLLRERASNPPAYVGGGDAVHPGPIGQTVMAWAVLKGLEAPGAVSRVEVDASSGKLIAAEKCKIENLSVSKNVIKFDRVDESLPMPVDERADAALKLAPVLADLSRYEFQVAGLAGGDYELSVDGEVVAKIPSADLAKGCNLTTLAGPITRQARTVLALVFKKNDVFFNRWRNVQIYTFPEWARTTETENARNQELKRLDAEIAEFERQIDEARLPKSHHFELKPAAN